MGPEWKWSLKLNSTFYIGEPEKELPGSLLILGVIDRPQDYEFFQPSSLSALAGTSPTVAPRPLHTLKELKLKSRPPSQKNVRVRRPQADSWPGSKSRRLKTSWEQHKLKQEVQENWVLYTLYGLVAPPRCSIKRQRPPQPSTFSMAEAPQADLGNGSS